MENKDQAKQSKEQKQVRKEYSVLKRFTTDKVNEFGSKVLLNPDHDSTKQLLLTKHIR